MRIETPTSHIGLALGGGGLKGRLQLWWQRGWLPMLLIAGATFWAYGPCLNGEFVWDDDAWTVKLEGLFQSFSGLGTMWRHVTVLQQYYPLTGTTFWLDYQLWGFWTPAYHVENVLLHLLNALLFWRLLRRLAVPGAGLAAAIFALHPLMTESAAWITERKNVLSLGLYLGALLSYGRFMGFWSRPSEGAPGQSSPEDRHWGAYVTALLLFTAADLAKATAFSLPAVLLLVAWWKRGRLRWRVDVLSALPFFVVSIGLGAVIFWLERTKLGASGPEWGFSWGERCLIAGRAVWFYLGKLVWPADLCFIYPRWRLDSSSLVQWLFPLAALIVVVALWLMRKRIGRGPLMAALYFGGTLFPVSGFMNAYFMRYSFVCDHWSYLSSLAPIALGAALATQGTRRLGIARPGCALAAVTLALFAMLTRWQSAMYRDSETLFRTTLSCNPAADMAHNNLGLLLFRTGQVDEALTHFRKAVELRPDSAHAHNNLANSLRLTGSVGEAIAQYELSLKLEPANARTWNNLATLLACSWDASVRNGKRAVESAQRASQLAGGSDPFTLGTLAAAFAEAGRFQEAVDTTQRAIELASQHSNPQLASALSSQLDLYRAGLPFHEPPPVPAAQQPR
jgi:Flp pilus assembly protein TadD